jgi:hypothetical protein
MYGLILGQSYPHNLHMVCLFLSLPKRDLTKNGINLSYASQKYTNFPSETAIRKLIRLLFTKINDTWRSFWKLDALCFLSSTDNLVSCDNTQRRAVGDRLTEHNMADVCDQMVPISVDSL